MPKWLSRRHPAVENICRRIILRSNWIRAAPVAFTIIITRRDKLSFRKYRFTSVFSLKNEDSVWCENSLYFFYEFDFFFLFEKIVWIWLFFFLFEKIVGKNLYDGDVKISLLFSQRNLSIENYTFQE